MEATGLIRKGSNPYTLIKLLYFNKKCGGKKKTHLFSPLINVRYTKKASNCIPEHLHNLESDLKNIKHSQILFDLNTVYFIVF